MDGEQGRQANESASQNDSPPVEEGNPPIHREVPGNQGAVSNQTLVERIDRSDRWMIGLTAAIAFSGIVSAVIFGWQLHVMQGQLGEMRSSSDDTKALIAAQNTQAKAVQALAEATRDMELDGRKTVAPILTTNNVPTPKSPIAANQVAVFSIFITNDGFASATHYRAWAKAVVSQSSLQKPITTLIPNDMPVSFLAKDQTAQELDAVTESLISQEDFEAIQRGDRAIYIFGEATYVDPYGEPGAFPIRFIYGRDPHTTALAVTANDFPVKEIKGD